VFESEREVEGERGRREMAREREVVKRLRITMRASFSRPSRCCDPLHADGAIREKSFQRL
jgi:hypothetical protein